MVDLNKLNNSSQAFSLRRLVISLRLCVRIKKDRSLFVDSTLRFYYK